MAHIKINIIIRVQNLSIKYQNQNIYRLFIINRGKLLEFIDRNEVFLTRLLIWNFIHTPTTKTLITNLLIPLISEQKERKEKV